MSYKRAYPEAGFWCWLFHRKHLIEHYIGLSDPWWHCDRCHPTRR